MPTNFSQLLFSSDKLRIGHFHAPCVHPQFSNGGKILLPTLVFPRSSVMIEHENHAPFLSDITKVNLYDGKHEYKRTCVAENDDICDWFEFDLSLFNADNHWQSSDEMLLHFKQKSVNSGYAAVVKERLLLRSIANSQLDPLAIEEVSLNLLQEVINCHTPITKILDNKTTTKHKLLSEALGILLEQNLGENHSLGELASQLNTSSYHLCRVFRSQTGMSIHQYRTQLRLKHALNLLEEINDISQVALELGFSSHSHFSTAFYKAYNLSPKSYLQQNRGLRHSFKSAQAT